MKPSIYLQKACVGDMIFIEVITEDGGHVKYIVSLSTICIKTNMTRNESYLMNLDDSIIIDLDTDMLKSVYDFFGLTYKHNSKNHKKLTKNSKNINHTGSSIEVKYGRSIAEKEEDLGEFDRIERNLHIMYRERGYDDHSTNEYGNRVGLSGGPLICSRCGRASTGCTCSSFKPKSK